jgi:HAD superfamily hydrolase (TIGR01509 family)
MIQVIIFDLDGVLVDAKEIHYEALNRALQKIDNKYIISRADHLAIYDGLPTNKKLDILITEKAFPQDLKKDVEKYKQEFTFETIDKLLKYDSQKCEMLKKLSDEGYKIYVASNSIRKTVINMLTNTGMIKYVDKIYGNEDAINNKPHPEVYLRAILDSGLTPKECLILEDSNHGRKAAIDSGANLLAVDYVTDVTYKRIKDQINKIDSIKENTKWNGEDFNVLVPMAGLGSRFSSAGYTFPKPLIEVDNKPMIQVVTENLNIKAKFIYIVQKSHYDKYNLKYLLNLITPNCEIIQVDGVTEGAACTTLLAKELINNDRHLLIANSDQFIEWKSDDFYYSMLSDNIDGSVITFKSTHPKWSFAKVDNNGFITEIAEKKPISDLATVGIYYWSKGSDYVKYAEQMIRKNIRVNNEFYVAPVYNEAILDCKKFKTFDIKKMHGLGTPEDLNEFIRNYLGS